MKELACAISGTVVYDHNLLLDCHSLDAPKDLAYCASLVVDGNYHR
jgi:hypothetical protein